MERLELGREQFQANGATCAKVKFSMACLRTVRLKYRGGVMREEGREDKYTRMNEYRRMRLVRLSQIM